MSKHVDISSSIEKVRSSGDFKQNVTDDFWQNLWNTSGLQEFWTHLKQILNEAIEKIYHWLSSVNPQFSTVDPEWFKTTVQIIVSFALIIAGIVLSFFIYKYILISRAHKKMESNQQDVIIRSEKMSYQQWLELADQLANKKSFRDSCRALFLASLHYLKEKAMIDFDEAKTNFEYLNSVRKQQNLYHPFKELVLKFEYIWYGEHDSNLQDYEFFKTKYDELSQI